MSGKIDVILTGKTRRAAAAAAVAAAARLMLSGSMTILRC